MIVSIFLVLALQAATPPIPPMPYADEIAAFRASDAKAMPPRCATLFVGSSTIRMWPDLSKDFAFPVIQRGFGGSTIADVDDNFATIVAPYHPRRIVFYAGDNDIDAGRSPAVVVADFRHFLALKDKALGRTPVYFLAIKPSVARWSQVAAQRVVNRQVEKLARTRRDLIYLDLDRAVLIGGKPAPSLFRDDGLHLNRIGYDKVKAIVTRSIAAHPRLVAPGCGMSH